MDTIDDAVLVAETLNARIDAHDAQVAYHIDRAVNARLIKERDAALLRAESAEAVLANQVDIPTSLADKLAQLASEASSAPQDQATATFIIVRWIRGGSWKG